MSDEEQTQSTQSIESQSPVEQTPPPTQSQLIQPPLPPLTITTDNVLVEKSLDPNEIVDLSRSEKEE